MENAGILLLLSKLIMLIDLIELHGVLLLFMFGLGYHANLFCLLCVIGVSLCF